MEAQVQVADETGCVDADHLSAEAAARLPGDLQLRVLQSGTGDERAVHIEVTRSRRVVWSDDFTLVPAECPGVVTKIVDKASAGTRPIESALPPRARAEWTAPVSVAFGLDRPDDARVGLGLGLSGRVGPGTALATLDAETALPLPLPEARIARTSGQIRVGWQVEDWRPLTLSVGIAGGAASSWLSTAPDAVAVAPLAEAWLAVGIEEAAHPRVSMRVRASLLRIQYQSLWGSAEDPRVLVEVAVAPVIGPRNR